ncbi:G-type lectin S-receptor-like serine/threonine-protein kinase RLK1 [Vitis vinifera]|uniref:G-type lectin S-receptor-like serine/threonine-protein kinase RLK1 n=1 Tax=Vitis vinifera TaxID=29760 RepID=A0A438EM24_VITVI|nr:G-type lectin S-receptor-like serine/threonine-protein kinase RLK1 [Vitis vinifera]
MKATNFLVKWILKEHSSYLQCIAQIYSNITLGSSLTALDNNSFWGSLSGDFAFGFQQIGGGGFLLAIWFNKVPEKTIIWSSNRNNVVQSGSKVQLTTDGLFVLTDSTGEQVWMADPAGNGVAVGEITGMKLQVNEEKATDMIERS